MYKIVQLDSHLICTKLYSYRYTPSVLTIILSGRTYSSQNVRQIWESTLSKSDYLVGHRGRGRTWEWIFKDFFYISRGEHFVIDAYLKVYFLSGMKNVRVHKYPSVFLPCTIFAPGKVAQKSIYNWNIVEKWRLNTHSLI